MAIQKKIRHGHRWLSRKIYDTVIDCRQEKNDDMVVGGCPVKNDDTVIGVRPGLGHGMGKMGLGQWGGNVWSVNLVCSPIATFFIFH